MAAITSQWRRPLVNAYEVKAGMVCLQCKNYPYLSASEVSFSRWGAIQIYVPFTLYIAFMTELDFEPTTTITRARARHCNANVERR